MYNKSTLIFGNPHVSYEGKQLRAAISLVTFFIAVDKESDLPWVNHPLPPKHQIKNKGEKNPTVRMTDKGYALGKVTPLCP